METKEKKCAKCKNPVDGGGQVIEGGEAFDFCKGCFVVLEKEGNVQSRVWTFLKDDENFPMTQVSRDMINARIRRNNGDLIWEKKVENG